MRPPRSAPAVPFRVPGATSAAKDSAERSCSIAMPAAKADEVKLLSIDRIQSTATKLMKMP